MQKMYSQYITYKWLLKAPLSGQCSNIKWNKVIALSRIEMIKWELDYSVPTFTRFSTKEVKNLASALVGLWSTGNEKLHWCDIYTVPGTFNI